MFGYRVIPGRTLSDTMSKVSTESSQSMGSPLVLGVLVLVSGVLATAINRVGGDWPLGLGGWGAAAFLLLGIGLVAYHFLVPEADRPD